ncbi:KRAB [Mytilus coruscus]|uniref:KRAB n=1 Tax=Mytilus coruscus TaxID=42192 RepID=A0A6J8ADN0_MYTCO|nr:KRAB [Mytilus coruscus]
MELRVDKCQLDFLGVELLNDSFTHDDDPDLVNNNANVNVDKTILEEESSPKRVEINIQCSVCHVKFTNKSNRNRHMKKHQGTLSTCNECHTTFFTDYDAKRHTNSLHRHITFDCEICSKKFQSKVGLKNHKKGHFDNYKFLCALFGRGFNYKRDYEGHIAGHNNEKNFECTERTKQFQYENSRDAHSKICGSKKSSYNHKCDICGRTLKCLKYLKEHIKMHTLPDRYQCSSCGNTYQHRSGLFKHAKKTGHK